MLKKKTLLLLLLFAFSALSAQENKQVFIVAGRVLDTSDSVSIRENFYAGLKEKISGNAALAGQYFRRVIETDPQNDAALYELAGLTHAMNNEAEAEDYARKAVTVNPDNKWYWLLLADIYKKNTGLTQLIPVFDELIRLDPDTKDYYFDKANAFFLLNKPAEAEEVYHTIENRFGSSADLETARSRILLKKEDSATSISRLEKLIGEEPSEISNYLSLAELYIKSQKPQKAISVLKKAQKKEPSNAFIHLLLSDSYRSSGKETESFDELRKAFTDRRLPLDVKIQIILSYFNRLKEPGVLQEVTTLASVIPQTHPSDPKAHAMYGDVLFQAQKFQEAKQSYKKALVLNNQIYLIWEQLLQLETADNDFKNAITDGEKAISLFPEQPPLYFFTAIAYAQDNQHEKAIEYLKTAEKLNPQNKSLTAQILSSMANSLNSLKKFSESDQAFERSLQLEPDNPYTLNNYAYYLSLRNERLDKAAEMSRRSNELQPNNSSFEDTFAWVLFMQKKYDEARVWIEKALKNNTGSGILHEHYGDILFNLGESGRALQQWQKAKDLGVTSETLEKKINEKKFVE